MCAVPVDVSVVVPAYNAGFCIRQCLEGLGAQSFPRGRHEIILVDDGSTDQTAALAQALKDELELPHLRIIRQQNAGPAAARNRGIREARGSVIAFLDSDCVPAPEWLENLTAPLLEDAEPAGIEGRTLPAPEPRTLMDHYIDNPDGGFYWTCNMAYRKADLLGIGGFDEGFPLPSGEDIDIAHRMRALGPLRFAPQALVYHLILKRGFRKHLATARTFSSMIRLHRKHPGLLTSRPGFAALAGQQFKYLLLPIVTQRREFTKAPLVYLQFCLLQVLMALDTLIRLPVYYREATGPLAVREPFHAESRIQAPAVSS